MERDQMPDRDNKKQLRIKQRWLVLPRYFTFLVLAEDLHCTLQLKLYLNIITNLSIEG